jgi:hypothetical protein
LPESGGVQRDSTVIADAQRKRWAKQKGSRSKQDAPFFQQEDQDPLRLALHDQTLHDQIRVIDLEGSGRFRFARSKMLHERCISMRYLGRERVKSSRRRILLFLVTLVASSSGEFGQHGRVQHSR